ncbi:diguanylate cyclase [Pseudidiomarina gelatinasegens]|uniref:sensor domain-containing diguanylate cyclase n=1 Tax=Pseudidiomarina gelatinasegens TaxID=2487740 RepID=UPI0030EEB5BF
MKSAPVPNNELERLHLLHELDILDTEPEPIFEKITLMVKQLFGVETVLISLIDSDRQWFKSKVGFNASETPREVSMCAHAIAQGSTMVINDTREDPRFIGNPLVTASGGIRFYAGAPIEIAPQTYIGTLCVIDSKPHVFTAQQQQWLETLAEWVKNELLGRFAMSNYEQERQVLAQGPVAAVVWQVEPEAHLIYVAENVERVLGYSETYLLDPEVRYETIVHSADRQELLKRMQAVLDGKQESLEIEYRVVTPSQDIRWVHHFARADRDHSGKIVRVRGYLHDSTKRKNLELSLQHANQSIAMALEAGNLATWEWYLFDQWVEVDHTWEELLGRDETYARNNKWAELIHPQDYQRVRSALQQHLKGKSERFESRFRLLHADGHYIWLHSIGKVIESNEQGLAQRMVGIHHDITAEVMNEQRRRQQEAVLSLVSSVQHEFLFVNDFSEVCDVALPKLMELTDSKAGLIGELPDNSRSRNMLWLHGLRILEDETKNSAYQKLIKQGLDVQVSGELALHVLVRGEPQLCPNPVQPEEAVFHPLELPELKNALILPLYFKQHVVGMLLLANSENGYQREQLATLKPMLNTLGTLMHIRRMDEERQFAVDELRRMATIDELTQIANRRVFIEAAEQRFVEQQRYDMPVSVAIIDLDHFKKVNDSFGHAAGDKVLKQFTDVAKEVLRDGDLLGRQGGEEFGILLPHADINQAMLAAERVREAIEKTEFSWDGKVIPVSISIGVAQLMATDNDVDRWFARADKALYQAKSEGRNRCIAADEV